MENQKLSVVILVLALSQGAHAMTFADSFALVLIIGISLVSLFACLGYYARRKALNNSL